MTGLIVWFTGLPAAGKSTLARAVRDVLTAERIASCVLDSDEVRAALRPTPGYSPRERRQFYETLAHLAGILAAQGVVVLVPATANLRDYRAAARDQAEQYIEVFVDASSQECAERDIKGLYAAARAGELTGLPGVDAPYEAPEHPDVTARGGRDASAISRIVALIRDRIARAPAG